jgi:excisionase family DNA binding protein
LTTSDVSKLLGIHRETLYQWIRDGRIPAMRIGRNLKFDPAALAVWLEARVAS